VSIPRRLGRLARGFVSGLGEEDRIRETLRTSRERSETLRDALGAAWRSASDEWRAAEARDREERGDDGDRGAGAWAREAHDRAAEEREASDGEARTYRQTAEEFIREWEARQRAAREAGRTSGRGPSYFVPRRYPPEVIAAYDRLGLDTGASMDEANRKRRDLVRRYHPDRFSDPEKRRRAERLTAEINASHDVIERYLLRK
jgi:DnaJ-domain-containing protein 1